MAIARNIEEFLREDEVDYERRGYFGERFPRGELRALLKTLGVSPADVLSRRLRVYQARHDELDAMSEEELLEAMVSEPTLLRRSIVVSGSRHVIGSKQSDLERYTDEVST